MNSAARTVRFLPALCLLLLAVPAQAEVFNTGRTLKQGAFSLSGEFQHHFAPAGDGANVAIGIGLLPSLDLGLEGRFPLDGAMPGNYWGLNLELGLLVDGPSQPALSLTLGAHVIEKQYAADATLIVSKLMLPYLEPYVAVDADIGIGPELGTQVRAVAGLCLPVIEHFELLVEGGLGLTASTRNFVSGGFNLYF
jgi:hypothetical protein